MSERERLLAEIDQLQKQLKELERKPPPLLEEESSGDAKTIARPMKGPHNTDPMQKAGETVSDAPPTLSEDTDENTTPARQQLISIPVLPPPEPGFSERYEPAEILGEGGMGEVRVCKDTRIGRTVALKVIRPHIAKNKKLRARFLFEAKIQGQLEHPGIVPVYDMGVRSDGFEYFTMKRVRGRTLHEVLKDLRVGDRGAATTWWTRRKLLAAFGSVCLAIEYAHQRGIIHRDIKPSNIMLGDFGEVSVLDWGLAKKAAPNPNAPMSAVVSAAPRERDDETAVGEVLGTPGYMSPEQAADSQSVDAKSDVFALGSILFEVLTFHPLVPGRNAREVASMTITGKFDRSIARRFPELDVPPELDAIVARATAHSTSERYGRAREVADAIERFLEGDRDVSRRRHIASKHVREAINALAEAADARRPEVARAARTKAIREVNHALALDPQNQTALRTMMKILTDVPTVAPPEAEAAVAAQQAFARRRLAKRGALAYLLVCVNLLLTAWLGLLSPLWLVLTLGLFLAAAAICFAGSRANKPSPAIGFAIVGLTSCGIAATSALFGPFIYVPSLCVANVMVFAGTERSLRATAIAGGVMAILLPLVLELTGVIAPSWIFRAGEIVIVPRAANLPDAPTLALLSMAALGTTILPALLVGFDRDARSKAERELAVRAYNLAELLPPEASKAAGQAAGETASPTPTAAPRAKA
jgi:serine/threonine-protein kinase